MHLGKHIGGGQPSIFDTEKPFSGYGFHITLTGDSALESLPLDSGKLLEILDGLNQFVTISTTYVLVDGTPVRKITQLPLMVLAEFAQFEEGIISCEFSPTFYGADKKYDALLKFYVPLTKNGNILFNNDEVIHLEIASSQVGIDVDVYTIESAIASPDYFKYSNLDVLHGKKEVVFPIGKYETVMIPLGALTVGTEISLTYTNGKIVRYKKPELEFIGLLVNDIVLASNSGQINGYGNYAIIDTSTVKEIAINRSTTSSFSMIAVEREVVKNVGNVQVANRGMVDLTEVKLNADIMERLS